MMGRVLGALIGASFFLWIAGTRALDPGEIGWLMRYDWPVHFFGWHFFRSESWQWPPGLLSSYYAPIGTAIGFTDSIPLVAFALKPFSGWLPATFQYIGPWLCLCFTLQGAFGAWLMSQWTPRAWVQASGAAFFVLVPALLIRIGHPSLCAHWLLLWALVIAARDSRAPVRLLEWAGLGAVAGLVHPYLAVMVLALLAAVVVRPSRTAVARKALGLGAAVAAIVAGWWAAGLFSVSGAEAMATEGLGHYSMNLLSPVTHAGWSQFLPDIPRATAGQDFEGFQYVGLGGLSLLLVALALGVRGAGPRPASSADRRPWEGFGAPLFLAALLMGVFALSPRVTAAGSLVVDLSGPWAERFAVFRATGRFFWPLGYLLMASALATIATRLPSRVALTVLFTLLIVQALDLHGAHEERRRAARDPSFYAWADPMTSPVWDRALPAYSHLVLYPPPQCGASPMAWEPAAHRAGLHGLTLNAGGVARPDETARLRYCHELGEQVKAGHLDPRTFYIVPSSEVESIRKAAQPPAVCGVIETVSVCVSAESYQRWRDVAPLQ
jgi:hypothetical protein